MRGCQLTRHRRNDPVLTQLYIAKQTLPPRSKLMISSFYWFWVFSEFSVAIEGFVKQRRLNPHISTTSRLIISRRFSRLNRLSPPICTYSKDSTPLFALLVSEPRAYYTALAAPPRCLRGVSFFSPTSGKFGNGHRGGFVG